MSTLLRLAFPKIFESISKHQMRGWIELKIIRNVSGGSTEDQNFWVKSPLPDIEPVVGKTLPEFIWEFVGSQTWGTKTAFECGATGRKYNFAELKRYSQGFGASLIKFGIERETVIGIVLPNIPEFPIALLGSLEAGCVVSTINPSYTPHEISRQLLNSNTTVVITIPEFLPAIRKSCHSCPNLKNVILISSSIPDNCGSFYDMMRTDPKGFQFLRGSEIDTTQKTALLPYSSGTTGSPKGVELTHQNLATNVKQHMAPNVGSGRSFSSTGEQERFIGLLPFFHIYGHHVFNLYGPCLGAHTFCLSKFDPTTFVEALRNHRPTILHLVTPLISFICQSSEIGKKELECVHTVVAGAAPIGETLINRILEKAGKPIFFQEAWGMTELSPMTIMLNPSFGATKAGSTGTVYPNTVAKVIDIGTGKALPANQNGEICIRGPQMMKGYLNNPKATAETIDGEGWLHTGDIGYYDHDGCFFIVDRLKELIKVKGFQVAPSELEDLLREHPAVSDVAVIGIPNEESGQLPRAYIVSKDPKLTAPQIHEFLKDKVTCCKQLKGGIEFVKQIPRSPSGKLLRRQILEEYKAKIKS